MISSKKGQRMIETITPIYKNSRIEQAIYEAIGSEFDDGDNSADEVLLQLFPQTATWGLVSWEQRLNISINLNKDIDKRRKMVIIKLQTRQPVTPERMANLLKNYTKEDIEITEGILEYTFEVLLKTKNQIGTSFKEVYNTVNNIKPAHMTFKIVIDYIADIYFLNNINKWLSEPIQSCGTIDVYGNNIISSFGISYESHIETTLIKIMTDEFKVASTDTFIIGNGKTLNESIELQISEYPSELLLLASEDNYIEGTTGKSADDSIENGISRYYSELIPKVSTETICEGGV